MGVVSVWTEGYCGCGAFILVPEGEGRVLCADCSAVARERARREVAAAVAVAAALAADPLRCDECSTRMLAPAVNGLCGCCDPNWGSVYQRACFAMGDAA